MRDWQVHTAEGCSRASSAFPLWQLAPVLAVKRQRLAAEHAASPELARARRDEYAVACALATSHVNPWFGGAIVPFNTGLNWSAAPNVEFDAAASGAPRVVGDQSLRLADGRRIVVAARELVHPDAAALAHVFRSARGGGAGPKRLRT